MKKVKKRGRINQCISEKSYFCLFIEDFPVTFFGSWSFLYISDTKKNENFFSKNYWEKHVNFEQKFQQFR